jgi:hypothetical protein
MIPTKYMDEQGTVVEVSHGLGDVWIVGRRNPRTGNHHRIKTKAMPPRISGFTPAQNSAFATLAESAFQTACSRGAVDESSFDAWLDDQLSTIGFPARRVPDRVKSFDCVMSHFAVIAEDPYWLDHTAMAGEIRMRHLVQDRLHTLSVLLDHPVTWAYCRSIYRHMHLPKTLDDANAQWLRKVLQALDTYIRRHKAQPVPTSSHH